MSLPIDEVRSSVFALVSALGGDIESDSLDREIASGTVLLCYPRDGFGQRFPGLDVGKAIDLGNAICIDLYLDVDSERGMISVRIEGVPLAEALGNMGRQQESRDLGVAESGTEPGEVALVSARALLEGGS